MTMMTMAHDVDVAGVDYFVDAHTLGTKFNITNVSPVKDCSQVRYS